MNPIQPGTVTRVVGSTVWVTVPAIGAGERPADYLAQWVDTDTTPVLTLPPVVGDRVLVALLNGSVDSLCVIGVRP